MIKPTIQIGNPILRAKSKNVNLEDIPSKKIQSVILDLIDSMRNASLVGMAAPQIGINLNVFVSEIRNTKFRKQLITDPVRIFINPKLTYRSQRERDMNEGCGSVDHGNLFGPVKRNTMVTITAHNEHGEKFTLSAKGLLAQIMQHEYDHLQGTLCIDKFSNTRKIFHKENRPKIKTS